MNQKVINCVAQHGVRAHIGKLRPYMEVNPHKSYVLKLHSVVDYVIEHIKRNAKLILIQPSSNIFMSMSIYVWIYSYCHLCHLAFFRSQFRNYFKLGK